VFGESQTNILSECIDLTSYEADVPTSKHIRAGAAKVVEIVAEKQPELRVFPILKRSMETVITNEQDWLLEALFRVLGMDYGDFQNRI